MRLTVLLGSCNSVDDVFEIRLEVHVTLLAVIMIFIIDLVPLEELFRLEYLATSCECALEFFEGFQRRIFVVL